MARVLPIYPISILQPLRAPHKINLAKISCSTIKRTKKHFHVMRCTHMMNRIWAYQHVAYVKYVFQVWESKPSWFPPRMHKREPGGPGSWHVTLRTFRKHVTITDCLSLPTVCKQHTYIVNYQLGTNISLAFLICEIYINFHRIT